MKKNILLFLFSITFSILFVEIFFRLFLPQNTSTPWRVYLEDGLLLNKNKGSAYHYYVRNNIKVKYTFGKYHNRIYNLNNSKDKILILGDSSIFGWLLNDEDTFVYKLAKTFPKFNFINSAAGGMGTSDQVRYYEKFCKKIKPISTLYIMNFADIDRSKKSNLYYLDKNNNLINGNNKIPKIYNFVDNNPVYDFLVSNFHIIGFLRKSYVRLINLDFLNIIKNKNFSEDTENSTFSKNNNSKNNQKIKDKYLFEKKLILKLSNLSKKCNSKFYLINFAWYNKKYYDSATYRFLNHNLNFLKENNINYINLEDQMIKKYLKPDAYKIKYDGHPNAKANELYFEILKKKLNNIVN